MKSTVILSEASELLRALFAQHQFQTRAEGPAFLRCISASMQRRLIPKKTVILSGARSTESKHLHFSARITTVTFRNLAYR